MLLLLLCALAAAAEEPRYAVLVRGDAFRGYGERRVQRVKNVLRCTERAAAVQRAVAAVYRANVVVPLERLGAVDVFLSGAGCAGDTESFAGRAGEFSYALPRRRLSQAPRTTR